MKLKTVTVAVALTFAVAGCATQSPTQPPQAEPSQQQQSTSAVGGVDPPEVALVVDRYSDCLTSLHADLSTARSAGSVVAINAGSTILQFTVSKLKNASGDPYTPAANAATTAALSSVGC